MAWAIPLGIGHVGHHCIRADQGAGQRMLVPIDGLGHRHGRQSEGQRSGEIHEPAATSGVVSRVPAASGRTKNGHRSRLCPK